MEKIIFNDGMKIVLYENNQVKEFDVDFFTQYITNSIKQTEKDRWKHSGLGAQFRGDAIYDLQNKQSNEIIRSEITSLSFIDNSTINYSVFINDISAVYSKNLLSEKDSESHIIHDNNLIIKGSNEKNNKVLLTLSNDNVTSHLAIFDRREDDYTSITDGDSFDENPSYSNYNDNVILFSSKGVGRDFNGNFIEYSPSSIYSYNETTLEVNEIYSDENYSFIKPKQDSLGNIYAIRKPIKEKRKSNLLLNIILIPFRIAQSIYYMFESFSKAFTGKGFTENNSNPAKNNNKKPNEIFIEGNLIYADKELKLNNKHKDDFAGIIPRSYELIKISTNNEVSVIKKGIIAFDIFKDNSLCVSNGKYILKTDGINTEKLCEGRLATCISIQK